MMQSRSPPQLSLSLSLSGKRSPVVKMGTEKAAGLLLASVLLHYALMFGLVTFKVLPLMSLLAAAASLPIAL